MPLSVYGQNNEVSIIQQQIENLLTDKNYHIQHSTDREFQIYFDTPDFILKNNNAYLVFQAKEYTPRNKKKKKISRLVSYKYNSLMDLAAKNYNRVKDMYDKHPLFFLVKRDLRKSLLEKLQQDDIKNPLIIKSLFNTARNIETFTIYYKKQKMLTIELTFYVNQVENMQFNFSNLLFKTEEALQNKPQQNNDLNKLKTILIEKLPQVQMASDIDNEYLFIFEQIKAQMGSIEYFLQYRDWYNFIMALIYALAGLIVIKLAFWQRINLS